MGRVSDHAIEAALSLYGSVQGPERHGKVEVRVQEGLYIASGVRFATFKPTTPKKAIPSYISQETGRVPSVCTTQVRKLRVDCATRVVTSPSIVLHQEYSSATDCSSGHQEMLRVIQGWRPSHGTSRIPDNSRVPSTVL